VRAGQGLILLVIALLVLGVVMVNSAGLTIDPSRRIDLQTVLVGRPTLLAGLAVVALLIGTRMPVERLTRRDAPSPVGWVVVGCVLMLLAVHVPGLGREVNGARRWVQLGPLGFQPSELAKWGMIVVAAWWAVRRADRLHRFVTGFCPPMLAVAAVCALIATEDLGTAVLIGAVALATLVAGGARLRHAALALPAGACAFAAAVMASPYRLDRLRAFLDPYQDPQGIGYHVLQSMAAVSGGGLAGRGLGNSVQKFGYLPEDTTDFLYAIVCEELGLVGAVVVVSLYGCLLLCGLAVIRRAAHPLPRLLGLGILLTIGLQALINMAVVTGTAPTKGIALPLLSSGGTGWLLTAFAVGVLVAIDRTSAPRERWTTRPGLAGGTPAVYTCPT
jgi:cell division protein FtsW